jgi:hypothetical protein
MSFKPFIQAISHYLLKGQFHLSYDEMKVPSHFFSGTILRSSLKNFNWSCFHYLTQLLLYSFFFLTAFSYFLYCGRTLFNNYIYSIEHTSALKQKRYYKIDSEKVLFSIFSDRMKVPKTIKIFINLYSCCKSNKND